ncbi:MAG: cysteine--tRNA ligase [Candidatus Pacebacteria bacterium]|nr:cysteine--tRNA ligase [Candidatus Paceibacterota bacterium]
MLKIYNTISRKKEIFKLEKGKKARLFVCGPTTYDFSHIGHARTYIIFDAFVKYLKHKGFKVFYLQNITDIDDKIIIRAKEKKVSPKELSLFFEKEYLKDMKNLKINSVDKYAKATDYIKEIISQINRLIEKGYGYRIKDGIYYDISKFKSYGKLSKRKVSDSYDAVSRIDDNKDKKNKGDFCLWKFSKEGEPKWKSPWGEGRPGWHIEDTAITEKYFGSQYDIHGGAYDLIFPHHEAEIAQMEAVSNKSPMVKYWMHTGFLTIEGKKMSKSLNNFITIGDFFKRHSYTELRFLVLKNLWRSPFDYSEKSINESNSALKKIEEFLKKLKSIKISYVKNCKEFNGLFKKTKEEFYSNLDDDFNTPEALASLFAFIRKLNIMIDKNLISKKESKKTFEFFKEINKVFEIIDFNKIKEEKPAYFIKKLLSQRERCRKERNWEKADEIRKKIEELGYIIEDTEQGPKLNKK